MSTVQGKKNRESMLQDANFDLWAREVVSQAILERLENASLATKRGPADRIAIFRRWRWTPESSSIERESLCADFQADAMPELVSARSDCVVGNTPASMPSRRCPPPPFGKGFG